MLVPFALFVLLTLGLKAGFKEIRFLAAAALVIALLSVISVSVLEAFAYTMFFVLCNLLMLRNPRAWTPKDDGR